MFDFDNIILKRKKLSSKPQDYARMSFGLERGDLCFIGSEHHFVQSRLNEIFGNNQDIYDEVVINGRKITKSSDDLLNDIALVRKLNIPDGATAREFINMYNSQKSVKDLVLRSFGLVVSKHKMQNIPKLKFFPESFLDEKYCYLSIFYKLMFIFEILTLSSPKILFTYNIFDDITRDHMKSYLPTLAASLKKLNIAAVFMEKDREAFEPFITKQIDIRYLLDD